ncbi:MULTISPECIES: hypothetical protein [unclassified Nonomuraea]|uniref:hypothetical protein n=1 Tax=unclassified Nonomuraea TaxID=2593643 RepID=UPI0035C0270D
MLVWINGPFGGGKTHTAHELHRRLPSSVVCDPEHVGFGLQQVADRIAEAAGLRLAPDTDGALRRRLRRIGVTLRHIRFG